MSNEEDGTSNAVAAVSNAASNAIDKMAELSRFVGSVFGPAIDNIGEIARQYAEYWRIRNALRLRDKLTKVLEARGSPSTRELPLRIGLPLLDAASDEDNDELQDLWAELLASAMTEKEIFGVTKSFVEVLKQLDPAEARLLKIIYIGYLNLLSGKGAHFVVFKLNVVQASLAVGNLERLGLIKVWKDDEEDPDAGIVKMHFPVSDVVIKAFDTRASLSPYGAYFARACTNLKAVDAEGGEFVSIDERFKYWEKPETKS